jgi:hypothetical protein
MGVVLSGSPSPYKKMRLATGLTQDNLIADFSKSALNCQSGLRSYVCLKHSQSVYSNYRIVEERET